MVAGSIVVFRPNTCPQGLSYACGEVPTIFDSPEWHDADAAIDKVWAELQRYEVVLGERPLDTLVVKTPVSYKMPKMGYTDALNEIKASVDHGDLIVGGDQWDQTKSHIIQSLKESLEDEI